MTDISKLMPIGHFSSLSRISVRMLRHYDANGVLAPAFVDQATGYRWYSNDQLREANEIRRLMDVGFGVSAIGALLVAAGPAHIHKPCPLSGLPLPRNRQPPCDG